MARVKRILVVLLLVFSSIYIFLLGISNSTVVDMNLIFIKLTQVRIELVIVTSFIVGGLFGLLSALPIIYKIRKKYRFALRQAKDKN